MVLPNMVLLTATVLLAMVLRVMVLQDTDRPDTDPQDTVLQVTVLQEATVPLVMVHQARALHPGITSLLIMAGGKETMSVDEETTIISAAVIGARDGVAEEEEVACNGRGFM